MIKIAVDAMGGDYAPKEIVAGTLLALNENQNIEITLFGDQNLINPLIQPHPRLKVIHTDKFFDMGKKDISRQTLRDDADTSMIMAINYVKDQHADALVSAGPTQALIFSSYFLIRPLKVTKRIAIAPMLPTVKHKPTVLLDAGGNIDAKPEHLYEFAVIAAITLREVYGVKMPTVGLINIGTEEGKGRELEKETYQLLKAADIFTFVGNIEPKEVLDGNVDILVSDGFTANIVMKTIEGTAKAMGKMLKENLTKRFIHKLTAGLFLRKPLKNFKKAMDPNEVGGAMIFGLSKVVVKAHGSSNAYAFKNAIKQATNMVEKQVLAKVTATLERKDDEDTL